jgi:serine/threonine protein kinase
VLLDFNAACKGSVLSPTGTRPYMSPEAWHTHALYNEMTDLWSAGVCLFFMLAGYLPWVGRHLHVLAVEVASFPIRMPAGLTDDALSILNGLLCRNVASRLMITGALAHPWCRLPDADISKFLGMQTCDGQYDGQPSYRDWEVRARKVNVKEVMVEPIRRSYTWPLFPDGGISTAGSNSPFAHVQVHSPKRSLSPSLSPSARSPMLSPSVVPKKEQWYSCVPHSLGRSQPLLTAHPGPWGERQSQWFENLSAAHSSSPCAVPYFWGWESRLRREHLADIYGSQVSEKLQRPKVVRSYMDLSIVAS